MADLTVIYSTLNRMPQKWHELQLNHLFSSIEDFPLISLSRIHMDLGKNIIQTGPISYWTYNKYLLAAAKLVKTPYIGIAQDDTLYTRSHFNDFRPKKDTVAYNRARWSLFTWKPDIFCMRQRRGGFALIAPTEFLIDCYEERMNKYPDGYPENKSGEIGRPIIERRLKIKQRKAVDFYSRIPIVNLSHPLGVSTAKGGKRRGQMQAYYVPYWGWARDIAAVFNDNYE